MKKSTLKLVGIIALTVVIWLCMATCSDDVGNDGGSGYLGNILELSGQVYLRQMSWNQAGQPSVSYPIYTGNGTIGNVGEVRNGVLSFAMASPAGNTYYQTLAANDDFRSWLLNWNDLTFSSTTRGYYVFNWTLTDSNDERWLLRKRNDTVRVINNTSYDSTSEYVTWIYVENDLTITGKGKAANHPDTGNFITTRNFTLVLKAGWNAVYRKNEWRIDNSGSSRVETGIQTIYTGNPSLRWALYEYN